MTAQQAIYYDTRTQNRLALIEMRPDGLGLFQDMDALYETKIVCRLEQVDYFPQAATPSLSVCPLSLRERVRVRGHALDISVCNPLTPALSRRERE